MFLNLLGTWLRGLFSLGLLVLGLVCVKQWHDHLPGHAVSMGPAGLTARPIHALGERLAEWDPDVEDPATRWLAAGLALLFFTFAGRFVTPKLWLRDDGKPRAPSPEVRRLKTRNGYHLRVDVYGPEDAPALVLVHGVGSDRTQWNDLIENSFSSFRIFAYDLLGHGRSDRAKDTPHTLDAAARDLDDVITSTGRDPVIVVGHSMGGMIAMTWCARDEHAISKLEGLVLVHTTPQDPSQTMSPKSFHRAIESPIHKPTLRLTTLLPWLVKLMNQLDYWNGTSHWANHFAMFGGSESRQQLEKTARLHAAMDPAAVARFTLSMSAFDVRRRLSKMRVRTLVVGADKDPTTLPEASRFIADQIPGAKLAMLGQTRHMGFMERSAEFADLVHEFHDSARRRETRRPRRTGSH